jgi:hypothetical protein
VNKSKAYNKFIFLVNFPRTSSIQGLLKLVSTFSKQETVEMQKFD